MTILEIKEALLQAIPEPPSGDEKIVFSLEFDASTGITKYKGKFSMKRGSRGHGSCGATQDTNLSYMTLDKMFT